MSIGISIFSVFFIFIGKTPTEFKTLSEFVLYLKGLTIIQRKKHHHHNPQQQCTTITTSHYFKP